VERSERPASVETFEHTADVGLVVRAATLEALFAGAADGLVALTIDPAGLRDDEHERVSITAADRAALLVAWLNEIVYLLDTRGFLPRRCRIVEVTDTTLTAELAGDIVDRTRHDVRRMVKAATYHGLSLVQTGAGWEARVILDL